MHAVLGDGDGDTNSGGGDRRRSGCGQPAGVIAAGGYVDHLPLYRLTRISARQGALLPRSRWPIESGAPTGPATAGRQAGSSAAPAPCLHADETPFRQLDLGMGKTKHAYL